MRETAIFALLFMNLKRRLSVSNDIELTPMMKQFLDLKAKHPDAVMLFRCGDFYETYSTDAIIAAEILGITLTKRANGKFASMTNLRKYRLHTPSRSKGGFP